MRGRDRFSRMLPLLQVLIILYKVFPINIRKFLLGINFTRNGLVVKGFRYSIIASLCNRIGNNVSIGGNVYLFNLSKISFGDNVSIHPFCYIDGAGGIEIGDNVSIAHGVTIMSTSHNFSETNIAIKDQGCSSSKVIIGNDVWIGAKATILNGVKIGNGVVIGAETLVNKNIPDYAIAVGIPVKIIKYRRVSIEESET